jgi:hypothetical protein
LLKWENKGGYRGDKSMSNAPLGLLQDIEHGSHICGDDSKTNHNTLLALISKN